VKPHIDTFRWEDVKLPSPEDCTEPGILAAAISEAMVTVHDEYEYPEERWWHIVADLHHKLPPTALAHPTPP